MNTPTHVLLSIAALTRPSSQKPSAGIPGHRESYEPTYVIQAALGAFVPDAAMFVFYGAEKFILGNSEREIWTARYFLSAWQDFFDLFNSIPIVLPAMLVAWQLGKMGWAVFFASMLLHIVCDFPLHHDDGHRHFWPLANWRYESPVSYWDPRHYGVYAGLAELVLFVVCYVIAMRKHRRRTIRAAVTALAVIHLGFMAFALIYWAGI